MTGQQDRYDAIVDETVKTFQHAMAVQSPSQARENCDKAKISIQQKHECIMHGWFGMSCIEVMSCLIPRSAAEFKGFKECPARRIIER